MKKNFLIVSFLFLIANSSAIAHDARSTNVVDTYKSTYLEARFTKKIKKSEVNTIVELGCFSGLDAVVLNRYYGKPVFTFECDDCRFEQILENIAPYPEVTLVPYGAWDETKQMTFYHSDFTGASSFYEFDEESLAKWNKLTVEELIEQQGIRMHPLEVNAIRLDEWMQQEGIEQIDLLCIDIQGAALNALKGLGNHIENVKYIITEVEYNTIYRGEALFPEIKAFMSEKGFQCFYEESGLFSDVLFVNKKYLN